VDAIAIRWSGSPARRPASAKRWPWRAPKIVDGVAKGKHEVRVCGREIHAILLKRLLPSIVARVVRLRR